MTKKQEESKTQLLYFTAPWCGPCRTFGPRLAKVAEDLKMPVVKIDADAESALVIEFLIMSIPTVVIMHDGEQKERLIGARSESQLLDALKPYV